MGCGMVAIKTNAKISDLPDSLEKMLKQIEKEIPAGVGAKENSSLNEQKKHLLNKKPKTQLSESLFKKAVSQLGTLGSGNHFLELCYDEDESCWIVLHSGSRGIGKELAEMHISKAKLLAKNLPEVMNDPELGYFIEQSKDFDHYIQDMLWAQDYARLNRELMADKALKIFNQFVPKANEIQRINCHHNFARKESFDGKELWITRKGAISAYKGELGIVPGSMGTSSYIVKGKGNKLSWCSSAHGAGRRLSRNQARKLISPSKLANKMGDITWLKNKAKSLVDEAPDAYKDIDKVIQDQKDLVEVVHKLKQVLNYKGT